MFRKEKSYSKVVRDDVAHLAHPQHTSGVTTKVSRGSADGSTSSKKTVSQVSTVKHMTVAKICELDCLTSLSIYYCLKLKGTLKNSGTWILKTSSLSSCRQKGVEDVRRIRCSNTGSCCWEQIQSAVLK